MTRANLECQPIFQEEAEIFAPRPCRRVRTGTRKPKCKVHVVLEVANNNSPVRHPGLAARSSLGEQLPRLRVKIRALSHQHI